MKALQVGHPSYLVFSGGLFLSVGIGFPYALATNWTVSSVVEAVLGVAILPVAFVAMLIGHHLLFRSPDEVRVDRENLVHFVALTRSYSVSAAQIESIHYGVGFRVAGRWLGSREGTPGLTIVHRRGVIAVPCTEPRRLARFLMEANPDIQIDDVDGADQPAPSSPRSAQAGGAVTGDRNKVRLGRSVWNAGFIALPLLIGAGVVYGINYLLTQEYWSLPGRLSAEDFRGASIVIWVVLSLMFVPLVSALGWIAIGVLKVATAIRYRHARRRKAT